jgi:hypothetical protein
MIPQALTQEDMDNLSTIERLRTDDLMEVDDGMVLALSRSMEDQDVLLMEMNSARESELPPTRRLPTLPTTPSTATSSTSESTSSEMLLSSGYSLWSPENPLSMPGGHPADESPFFLAEAPPPNYAIAVKLGQAKPLCVVRDMPSKCTNII